MHPLYSSLVHYRIFSYCAYVLYNLQIRFQNGGGRVVQVVTTSAKVCDKVDVYTVA